MASCFSDPSHIQKRCRQRFSMLAGISLIAISIFVPSLAEAQERSNSAQLSDIIVTAQKRSENLQKVPVSVAAFDSDSLAQSGVTSVPELARLDSSLNVAIDSGTITPFLRGIGNPQGSTVGNENSVPVYIDGVYYARAAYAVMELSNIERVEVLKGPQGTLFGRNASGGLMHVITGDPSLTEAKGRIALGYGNYNTISGQFYATTPLSDRVGVDISVAGSDQKDGWGTNFGTGNKYGYHRFINVRSKIKAELTESTTVKLAGFFAKSYSQLGSQNVTYRGTRGATHPVYGVPGAIVLPLPNFYDSNTANDNHTTVETYGGSLQVDQDLGFAELVSISAYRTADDNLFANGTKDGTNALPIDLFGHEKQFTQELQLKSQTASAFDWIVGAYYMNLKQGYSPSHLYGDSLEAGGIDNLYFYADQRIKSYSGYTQATFHVVPDGTNITLGLRYTSDKVRGIGSQIADIIGVGPGIPIAAPYDKQFTFNKLTYKVALDHQFTDDVMGYVSFSRGYKSGTFNTIPLASDPTRAETVDAYEAGIKSELLDRRVRINMAIFQYNIKDPQVKTVSTVGGFGVINLLNAGSARVRGAEVELKALVANGLQLRFDATYLDPKYTSFANAPYTFTPVNALCPSFNPTDPMVPSPTGVDGGLCNIVPRDAKGNNLILVPKWRFNAGANYSLQTASGDFDFDVNAAFTGRFPWAADNLLFQTSYVLVSGSISYSPPGNDQWSLRLWGKNLTGTKYYSVQSNNEGAAGAVGGVGAPRTFGAEVSYKF